VFKNIVIVVSLFWAFSCYANGVQRIIALSPHAVEMLFAIGAGDRIVATVEYADYPQQALKIPRIGSYAGIQIEQLLVLQPDLVVAWKSGNKLSDLKKIESLNFPLLYTHPQTIPEIKNDLLILGKKLGLQQQAQQAADNILKKYQQLKSRYASQSAVKVFYQLWHEPLRTIGGDSWIDSMISDCGGENIFKHSETAYPVVSLESILLKNPQVIIIPFHSGNLGNKTKVWQNWRSIEAVKNNTLFSINGDLLHRFGPRAVDGMKILCEKIDSGRS
jgi:vitamin B12 transport system substrate-binding protein